MRKGGGRIVTIRWSGGGGRAYCDNQMERGGAYCDKQTGVGGRRGRIVTIRWRGGEEACCDNQTKCVYGGGVVL